MPWVPEADRKPLDDFLMRSGRPARKEVNYVHESTWADFLADRNSWGDISDAPRDGREIEVLYDDGWNENGVYWSRDRACVLGRRAGSQPPGWVSTESGHLPVGGGPFITHYRI